MTVLDDVRIDTDVESLINSAFDQLDCCSQLKDKVPCGGEVSGYGEFHDCNRGWLCKVHWDMAVEKLPKLRKHLEQNGSIGCAMCLCRFEGHINNYVRLTPL